MPPFNYYIQPYSPRDNELCCSEAKEGRLQIFVDAASVAGNLPSANATSNEM